MTEETQGRYAEKISMLLAKAESTNQAEAEAIMAKVQQLMTLYAIDEQMIARAQGKKITEEIVEGTLVYTGIFQQFTMNIGFMVARNNNCKAFFTSNQWARPKNHTVHLFGFESDVHAAKLLATSLEVQCAQAMLIWSKTAPEMSAAFSPWQRAQSRRGFIMGFANAIGQRLAEAVRLGREDAANAEAKRSRVAASAASDSVALVLRDRSAQVTDWFDTRYGRSLKSVSRNYKTGGVGAREAGRAAGRTANIGQPGVGGGSKSIGRGGK